MYLFQASSLFGISYFDHLRVSASQLKCSSQAFLSAAPFKLLNFSTPNRYPISYSYQLLLSPYYTAAAQTAPCRYSFQLFLLAAPSYSYQLLLSATLKQIVVTTSLLTVSATPCCIHYSYKLAISATISRYCYQITLSHTPTSYLHQLFFSDTFISNLYLPYTHTPIRHMYQNPFVTNHYQLLVSLTPQKRRFAKFLQNSCSEKFCNINSKTPVLVFLFNFIKKRLLQRCFLVNTGKFLKIAFFIEHLWWLFLTPIRYACHFGKEKQ